MTLAPASARGRVCAVDLPQTTKYITDAAAVLRWAPEREPAFVEYAATARPAERSAAGSGLRTDAEFRPAAPPCCSWLPCGCPADARAVAGAAVLGIDLYKEAPDYVLYAADPERFHARVPGRCAERRRGRWRDDGWDGGSAGISSAVLQPRPPRGRRCPAIGCRCLDLAGADARRQLGALARSAAAGGAPSCAGGASAEPAVGAVCRSPLRRSAASGDGRAPPRPLRPIHSP